MNDYIYDIETYPNVFTFSALSVTNFERFKFEISFRRNDVVDLVNFIYRLKAECARGVGFNNIGFDYPVLHYIIENYQRGLTPYQIYERAMLLIKAEKDVKFSYMVWDDDRHFIQLDLYKIHHFDNVSRATSLKVLEFNMRSDSVEELPFPVGSFLDSDQIDTLVSYNDHDVDETYKFYLESLDKIRFRMELSEKYDSNFLNHNDTKIGKDYFIMELEKAIPGTCYQKIDGKRTPRQTWRKTINLKDVIFPYIHFTTPEFERMKQWLISQTITETKGVFKDLSCTVNGFKYVFGVGGIHGSIDSAIVESDEDWAIVDVDVTSFYPSLGIANRIYPEHLSEQFCDIYESVKNQRMTFTKGTPENAMLKLALNGVYGDSNNVYSPFYDPLYTMKITINGQLLLCLLAEMIAPIPGLKMIQANTDGITVKIRRTDIEKFRVICKLWENITCLQLEEVMYSRMFIRDVNNYIAETVDGKLKNKGAYEYKLDWCKNHSSIVVAKAAGVALVHGVDIREFITNHEDFMDFMLRTKVPRTSKLVLTDTESWGDTDFPLQNVTRYYISTVRGKLIKIMPPLAKKPNVYRRIGINVTWDVYPCNNIKDANRENLNYEWYIQEAEKLVKPLRRL